jgi:hypothetical protein
MDGRADEESFMATSTWDLQIVMSEADDTVYAHATLVGAPHRVSGLGRAAVPPGGEDSEGSYALAARRCLADLGQSLRVAFERPRCAPDEPR